MKRAIAGATVVLLLGLTACTSSTPKVPSSSAPAPIPIRPSGASPSGSVISNQPSADDSKAAAVQLVGDVVIAQSDVSVGTVQLVPSGDQVDGEVTLDYCGHLFTTEAYRLARRRITVLQPNGDSTGISNEVVAYDTPQHAAQALAELRVAAGMCPPKGYENETVTQTPLRYAVSALGSSNTLPIVDNALITSETFPAGSAKASWGRYIVQVRGSVLDLLVFRTSFAPTPDNLRYLEVLGASVGTRMKALVPA